MKLQNRAHILVLVICLEGFLAGVQAVVPPPDGGYPNFNTAEGQKALFGLTSGQWNTALGAFTLWQDTDGSYNTAVGTAALLSNNADENTAVGVAALLFNTTGNNNTAVGATALLNNTAGSLNTATGASALSTNTSGAGNTAVGGQALSSNTTGNFNTANGVVALADNTEGVGSTATGTSALQHNTTGGLNTATGVNALTSNTTGTQNTAIGANALFSNVTGDSNTATGYQALSGNTGSHNSAFGKNALAANVTGANNTAIGEGALENADGNFNTGIGSFALLNATSGGGNTALGAFAGSNVINASQVVAIDSPAANVGNSCFIGHIRGVTTANSDAIPVLIDSAGQLGTMSSSKRFKKEIKPMDKESEAILALKPVTFHYKSDKSNTPQFGLIAEDVAEVSTELVVRDENGDIYTVRYDQVNAMLLNEFLKEHHKVEAQECKIREQESGIARLKNEFERLNAQQQKEMQALRQQLNHQAVQIQRVTGDLKMRDSAPASQVVVNRP